jgi:hypothetical protein
MGTCSPVTQSMTIHQLLTLLRSPRTLEASSLEPGTYTVSSGPAAPLELDSGEVEQAIQLFREWCTLLKRQLAADPHVGPLPAALPDAEQSGLGQWIVRNSQAELTRHPQMIELALENRRINHLAQEAIDLTRIQRLDLASKLLNLPFERSRSRLLQLLQALKKT